VKGLHLRVYEHSEGDYAREDIQKVTRYSKRYARSALRKYKDFSRDKEFQVSRL
jgi:hypothetical protein